MFRLAVKENARKSKIYIQNTYFQKICTIGTVYVHIPRSGALQFRFSQNYFDSHISACREWNCSKFFIQNTYYVRKNTGIISVIIPHQGALQLRFVESSCDSHNLASIAWNNTKLNIRYTYYKARHSYSLCANSSLRGAAMPL